MSVFVMHSYSSTSQPSPTKKARVDLFADLRDGSSASSESYLENHCLIEKSLHIQGTKSTTQTPNAAYLLAGEFQRIFSVATSCQTSAVLLCKLCTVRDTFRDRYVEMESRDTFLLLDALSLTHSCVFSVQGKPRIWKLCVGAVVLVSLTPTRHFVHLHLSNGGRR